MITDKIKREGNPDISVEERLRALYQLQKVSSEIDKIKILRGELPLEVQDLEDEIAGLQTRIEKYKTEITELNQALAKRKNEITESESLIKRYEEQQNNVRNNREYDALSKEIEYQKLEIELSQKRISEHTEAIKNKEIQIEESNRKFAEREDDLKHKKDELNVIIAETQKDEDDLGNSIKKIETLIEPRLLTAFNRIRGNAINGLAVVTVQRDACGGCFNKIPPQRQLDIKSRKKIIVCEYCGRILVDDDIENDISE